MGFNTFSTLIGIRTALIMLTLIAITTLIYTPGYHAAILLMCLLIIGQCYSLVKFVGRTNAELVRFLDAARFADYSQRFELKGQGTGFSELGDAFADILERFQSNRQEQEQKLRHLKAVVEHLPVPLISLKTEGKVKLWNNAARRLFGSNQIVNLQDFNKFGEEFTHHLSHIQAGEKRLVSIEIDDMSYQLSISMTDILVGNEQEKLISLQDIQNELDTGQLKAWQDLVRVLTHEIMNSITPISSLAQTAADLVSDTKTKLSALPDIQGDLDNIASAAKTVARRSNGLMAFVSSYRKLTRLPPPKKDVFNITQCFKQVIEIMTQENNTAGTIISYSVIPSDLSINADADMLEQILINLVKNAQEAMVNIENPSITLSANINRRGRVAIEVSDNGGGIPEDMREKIFVPFYTTKKEGSGVGLALTRQVMNAHGGSIKVSTSESGGALFTLVF